MTELMWNLVEVVNIVLELFIISTFFSKLFKCKHSSQYVGIAVYAAAGVILCAAVLMSANPIMLLAATTVLLLLLAFIVYEGKAIYKLFYVFIYMMIIMIADPILMGMLYILNFGHPEDFLFGSFGRILGMIAAKILYMWMVVFITRILMKKVRELPLRYWITIILIPIISVLVLFSISTAVSMPENSKYIWINISSIFGIAYINIAMFNFFDSYSNQIKLSFMETVAEREAANYKLLKLSYQDMKRLKHDIQNELIIINDLIADKKYEAAESHGAELSRFVEKSASVCYTGNEAVDSLINIKGITAAKMNIRFITKMKIITEMRVNSLELCRIIGNALDNAIEACCKIPIEERYICVSIKEIEGNIMLEITNSSYDVDTEDFSTTKKNKKLHGYGISSIRSSAERIGGILSFDYSSGEFSVKLITRNIEMF